MVLGELIPLKGGDPIPLLKRRVVIGRRADCDIVLAYPNVSSQHCELVFAEGVWIVKDLGSTNGVKVNGQKIEKKRLGPGDELAVARKHRFRVDYVPDPSAKFTADEPAAPASPKQSASGNVFGRSLLEAAGLAKPAKPLEFDSDLFDDEPPVSPTDDPARKRWDIEEE